MAKLVDIESIGSYFQSLTDPRHMRNRKHLLGDVIVIVVSGMICGCDGPTAIHRWASEREEWLKTILPLPHGIPSRDCMRRLLIALNPEAFQECFQKWIAEAVVIDDSEGSNELHDNKRRLVAIDGKTARRSHDAARDWKALHIVSAWASEEGIALGQVATEEKSNEITAIPELLKRLELQNTVITIDAMGCQKEIAREITDGGGDFVLAVKDNQPKLCEAIAEHFAGHLESDMREIEYRHHETHGEGHGRIDERSYYLTEVPKDFPLKQEWPWVKALGYSLRVTQHADGRETGEVHYYILSRYLTGKRFAEAVRGHWSIESMHWVLDVTMREDDSRARERTLGNNLSWLRRFAVTLLKRHPANDSIRGKMLRCLMNPAFLTQVLTYQQV